MKHTEREVISENQFLQQQLKEMENKRSKQYSSTRGRANPLKSTKFTPRAMKYKGVNSKLDYESAKEKEQYKREHFAQLREELELRECTFKPNVDINSMTMTQKNPKTPIDQRNVPDRYQRKIIEERAALKHQEESEKEFGTMRLPNNKGRKANADFYGEKIGWKANRDKKRLDRHQENITKEKSSYVGKPKLNDYSKNKIVPADRLDNDPFLNRVAKRLEKKKELKKTLDEKYYNYSYKPALYKPGRTGEININA